MHADKDKGKVLELRGQNNRDLDSKTKTAGRIGLKGLWQFIRPMGESEARQPDSLMFKGFEVKNLNLP